MIGHAKTDVSLETTADQLQALFRDDPPIVALDLERVDDTDRDGMPIMPVPAMVGPFERISRTLHVRAADRFAASDEIVAEVDGGRLTVTAEHDVTFELGVAFLKVSSPSTRPA